jgi:flavin reductase (DIM6/NTAB) family NADH-FMN oxidoreductase RutF
MFYETANGHGLRFDPFKAIVAPRPIGWISTLHESGVPNLGPYSFFAAMASEPPIIAFSTDGYKDSLINARKTGEFVYSLSTLPLARQMNASAQNVPPGVNEFELAGLTPAPSRLVKPPRVKESPAALECVVTESYELKDRHGRPTERFIVLGQVVAVHIDDAFIRDGRFDTKAAQPLSRLGYRDYASLGEFFEMALPKD